MMQTLINKLGSIELKLRKLAQQHEYLKRENMMLIEENIKLRQHLDSTDNKINIYNKPQNEVHPPTGILEADNAVQSGEGTNLDINRIRKEIDQYIADIEKCIELAQTL